MLVDAESLPYELLQVVNRLVRLDRKVEKDAAFGGVEGHPEELLLNQSDLGDGQRDIHVRLKSDRNAVAVRTLDS